MTLNRQAIRQEFNREMTKARERITTTVNGEIGWLVQFIQLDLDFLTPSEWMVLAYEVASFTEVDFSQKLVFPVVSSCGWSVQALPGETQQYTLPSRKEAAHLQGTIRGYLEALWTNAVAPITFSDLTVIVTLPGAFHDRYGSVLVATKPKTKECEYRVAVLLAHHAGRIRLCQECRVSFWRRDAINCFVTPAVRCEWLHGSGERTEKRRH